MRRLIPLNTDTDGCARTIVLSVYKRGSSCYLGGGFKTTGVLEVTYEEDIDDGEHDG